MKLGVFTPLYQNLPFETMLDQVKEMGLETVELGTGNYPGNHHCDPDELLQSPEKAKAFMRAIESRGLSISGLSFHGNPLHPNKKLAKDSHEVWRKTVLLAEKLEIPVVNGFSGCPGDYNEAKNPNWVTCSWPPEFTEVLNWQWNEVVIPYWKEEAKFARSRGIQVAFEMHPGFVVYNPETLLKLREHAGDNIGANFDPSHLVWQGIDPITAIKKLGRENAIFHFHAKDTYLDKENIKVNGVLDTKHYSEILDRSWTFRSVGYGHEEKIWKDMISTLRAVGYDYVISIEHEDMLASTDEGLKKAISLLKGAMFKEELTEMWWA
ncbi:sugar phosphate isomerase/epimerase [Priestia flexa]|uniref:Sugar phosphate isomerase/epimerase n=1 Tax=Priestia flexa TaxID=86664 RepID=A0A8I1MID3_9BACI|nr:sugar phosphate isomerase/epimerase [Priestia flexa]MBN8252674.1 sugar phosphate isomerase/epimerase [Priestia flexa]MBN8434144.1 sugar phosphate isomerase/epimerase [Priestia flexa]MCA0966677.1 sugar phosphate isomerase/epimerase [Priestia flexa]MDW8517252.1 sugar phosphate isomerase/epimerase [Priestia flexa]UIR31025.1 sugar phosphate isomerase/epimerase [Priestia flexa]